MVLHHNPANLDNAFLVTTDAEVHSIRRAILRQVRAVAGVTKVAALSEFPFRRRHAFIAGRGAVTGKAIAQRKATPVRPQFGIMSNGRKEVGTGQATSLEWVLRAHCSPGRPVEIGGIRELKLES
jgi:hypothetical protein